MNQRLQSRISGACLAVVHIGALAAFIPALFSWPTVAFAWLLAYLTGVLGITLCFHRTLTHRSLRLRKPLEYVLAVLGTLAMQGDPITWVATHRKHHAHADHDGDPHSIHLGFQWAHMDWIYRTNPALLSEDEIQKYAPDLCADPFYRALRWLSLPLQFALGFLFLAVGGWSLVVWGIFVRLVFAYHSTWLVNSAAHMLGYRSFKTADQSTNCWWVALVSFGEGWHNNHHAFPFSARHGLRWFEIDVTWWHVKLLAFLRLADRIKIPSRLMQERLRAAATVARQASDAG